MCLSSDVEYLFSSLKAVKGGWRCAEFNKRAERMGVESRPEEVFAQSRKRQADGFDSGLTTADICESGMRPSLLGRGAAKGTERKGRAALETRPYGSITSTLHHQVTSKSC